MTQTWKLNGELIINCNCAMFCPCVISLGKHEPTVWDFSGKSVEVCQIQWSGA